ncbi:MAG: ABC transporter ATP-binding protein [Candidatus Fimadaptatus sp.]|jgi:branched-chain amino acid transport system ATP-binding protein
MLKANNLHVYYGAIHAIKDVSFHVDKGEIVTLIGANGAGKSTILNTISGLLRPRVGGVEFLDKNITGMAPHKIVRSGLVQVPEGRKVFSEMTVQENLEIGAYAINDKEKIEKTLDAIYRHFPRLKERRRQQAGTLSGGEQQMLAMGRALMSDPTLLMLDEPSMGLSPIMVSEIFEIIQEVNRSGITIFLVEQNAKMALSIANRAYVLETGKVIMEGDAHELMDNDEVRKAYLGA